MTNSPQRTQERLRHYRRERKGANVIAACGAVNEITTRNVELVTCADCLTALKMKPPSQT